MMKLWAQILFFLFPLWVFAEGPGAVEGPMGNTSGPADFSGAPSAEPPSSGEDGDDFLELAAEQREISKRYLAKEQKSQRGKTHLLLASRWQAIGALPSVAEKTEFMADSLLAIEKFFKDKKLAETYDDTLEGLHKTTESLERLHEKLVAGAISKNAVPEGKAVEKVAKGKAVPEKKPVKGRALASPKAPAPVAQLRGKLILIDGNLNRLLEALLDAVDYTDDELEKFVKANEKKNKKGLDYWNKVSPLYFYKDPAIQYINKVFKSGKVRTTVDQLENLSW